MRILDIPVQYHECNEGKKCPSSSFSEHHSLVFLFSFDLIGYTYMKIMYIQKKKYLS
jgi:hypothetical protein